MIFINEKIKKIIYRISSNPALRFLNSKDAWLEKDIFTLASIVFNIEKVIKMGGKIDKLRIPISMETDTDRDFDRITELLNKLFIYVLFEDINIEFDVKDLRRFRRNRLPQFENYENVCLFSGGVDSLSGLLSSKKYFGEVHGVFTAHGDQTWGVHIVNNLIDRISKVQNISCSTLYAPAMESHGYSQLRGFLYVLFGAIYVSLLNSKNLIIAECGPTMYQPRFFPYDTVTMTTHPYVMRIAKEIIEILLKRKINFIMPYENMTKAEVIMASPYKEFFNNSHSCITLRFGKNEGTCYGCIIRRLGFLVADIKDTTYSRDPIGDSKHDVDNLSSLLSFSFEVLFDYKNMPYYSKENIEAYNKKDLFKRFALDNFAAIHEYRNKYGKLNPYIKPIYDEAIELLGEQKIRNRINKVRGAAFKPNFEKFV